MEGCQKHHVKKHTSTIIIKTSQLPVDSTKLVESRKFWKENIRKRSLTPVKNGNAVQNGSSHLEQTAISTGSWRGVAIVVCVWGGLFSFKVLFWGCLQCSPTAPSQLQQMENTGYNPKKALDIYYIDSWKWPNVKKSA